MLVLQNHKETLGPEQQQRYQGWAAAQQQGVSINLIANGDESLPHFINQLAGKIKRSDYLLLHGALKFCEVLKSCISNPCIQEL
jgi:hypothetical protein